MPDVNLALAERLLWVFRRTGEVGEHTKPFQLLPGEAQAALQAESQLLPDEIPVLACYVGPQTWSLQTTRRLLWRSASGVNQFENSEIVDATVDREALFAAGSKSAVRRLLVRTRKGDAAYLDLEPGAPFFGFWNVLKTIAAGSSTLP